MDYFAYAEFLTHLQVLINNEDLLAFSCENEEVRSFSKRCDFLLRSKLNRSFVLKNIILVSDEVRVEEKHRSLALFIQGKHEFCMTQVSTNRVVLLVFGCSWLILKLLQGNYVYDLLVISDLLAIKRIRL